MVTRFKFRHVNELNGLFVLGVLALVLAGAIFSARSQRWFTRKYTFDVLLPEEGALGLRPGDEVFILGVSVGLVDQINVGEDGRMKARVKTRRDFARFVRVDSTASIKKVFGVAGDSFLEISRGSGAVLPSQEPAISCVPAEDSLGRMEKMLADLRAEVMPVVKKAGIAFDEWTQLGGGLQKNGQQMYQFVERLDNLTMGLEKGKGTVGRLLTDTALADEAQSVLRQANEAMGELRGVMTNANAAVTNVQRGTARLPEVADVIANEAKDLPGLVEQTRVSMRELERLIEALQRHWLVRKYMDNANPPPARALPEGTRRARPILKP